MSGGEANDYGPSGGGPPRHGPPSVRRRNFGDAGVVLINLALVVLVLLPAYLLAAALLEVALGRSPVADIVAVVEYHARDRWWVPLFYLFAAPFVSWLLIIVARSHTEVPLRRVAMVAAPLGFLAIFWFLVGARAPGTGALVRAAAPGVLATLAYASVMRLPVRRRGP
ncbi:MAG TPA: hypothetical protein VMM18_06005 [Gemmatimonadaceae bacterium]|nr:hypothetical protein [Gemmatimonadaceae bacterium]